MKLNNLEKENQFNKLFAENKVVEAQREAFMSGDMVKFSENAVLINGETTGNNGKDSKKIEDAEEEILKLAEEKMTKDKNLTFGEAITFVKKENPELTKQYESKFNKGE